MCGCRACTAEGTSVRAAPAAVRWGRTRASSPGGGGRRRAAAGAPWRGTRFRSRGTAARNPPRGQSPGRPGAAATAGPPAASYRSSHRGPPLQKTQNHANVSTFFQN